MQTEPREEGNANEDQELLNNLSNLPQKWFQKRFPELFKKHQGNVVNVMTNKKGEYFVESFNENFMAETLGELGSPKCPSVYVGREARFYRYEEKEGIFTMFTEDQLVSSLSTLLQQCASDCEKKGFCDTTLLRYQLSKSSQLKGVIIKAKGLLHVSDNYFYTNLEEYIACKNGMLKLSDMQLFPFSPSFRRRNKLSVAYDPNAKCPVFENTLMRQSLDEDDIAFLQEWFGVALLGKNVPQVIVILFGTAGAGKSTFSKVVAEIIGTRNVQTLRTEKLGDKFETSFCLGKTLLLGVDVASNFLTHKSASALKSLTGGDIMNVEVKYCAAGGPEIEGYFNVLIICNTLPNIRLEGDAGAWKRRLHLVNYNKPKSEVVITSLADIIVKDEGSGVLNWALDGLMRIRAKQWRFNLTEKQKRLVDDALLQSDSPRQFVYECLAKDDNSPLLQEDCYNHYHAYCLKRNWPPMPYTEAMPQIVSHVTRTFALTVRHDIRASNGKEQRGWKGIRLK